MYKFPKLIKKNNAFVKNVIPYMDESTVCGYTTLNIYFLIKLFTWSPSYSDKKISPIVGVSQLWLYSSSMRLVNWVSYKVTGLTLGLTHIDKI